MLSSRASRARWWWGWIVRMFSFAGATLRWGWWWAGIESFPLLGVIAEYAKAILWGGTSNVCGTARCRLGAITRIGSEIKKIHCMYVDKFPKIWLEPFMVSLDKLKLILAVLKEKIFCIRKWYIYGSFIFHCSMVSCIIYLIGSQWLTWSLSFYRDSGQWNLGAEKIVHITEMKCIRLSLIIQRRW